MRAEARTALVIEDHGDIRHLLEVVLRRAGFEVESAATGRDGVARAREGRPDLITLDVGLPDIDGYEVADELRTFFGGHLVLVTARSGAYDVALGERAGADGYLTKPFRPAELRELLDEVLARPPRGPA